MEEQFFAATGVRLTGLADCTLWIKWGSYNHGLVAKQRQLHRCPHLVGIEPPCGPQMTPSESHLASQKKAEGPVTSTSTPSLESSPLKGATADVPTPRETGGAGDGGFWVDRTQAEDDFQIDRPMKRRQSQSRRRGVAQPLPFLLQDEAGRCAAVQQLYVNAGQQLLALHNVAVVGILHLHPEVLPCNARSMGNQVLCMIAEYHLTSQVWGTLSLSPVLPEVVVHLMPTVEDPAGDDSSQGTRDVRVVERTRTLQIGAWLHHLDMEVERDVLAPSTLEPTQHVRGPLLDMLLAPQVSNLTFEEVVDYVLEEDTGRVESSLAEFRECYTHTLEELEGLVRAHSDVSDEDTK